MQECVTTETWELFFRELARFGNVSAAAETAGVSRQTVYRYIDADEEFKKRFNETKRLGVQGLEDEAVRRAADGYEEPVFYQGVQMDRVRKYSDGLLTLLLKGGMPDKYRERTEISGPDGGPIQLEDTQVATKLAAILVDARRRAIDGECEDVTDQQLIEDGSDLV